MLLQRERLTTTDHRPTGTGGVEGAIGTRSEVTESAELRHQLELPVQVSASPSDFSRVDPRDGPSISLR